MTNRRQERVSELLKEELGILITELEDERLADAMLAVTRVEVSADLRNARVFVLHALPPTASRRVIQALAHAEGFFRKALVENLNLRYVPNLTFQVDDTTARRQRVDELLDEISKKPNTPE